jgi:hypothetical protein
MLLLRPDLDSSQDLMKVSQGIFYKKPKTDEVIDFLLNRVGRLTFLPVQTRATI